MCAVKRSHGPKLLLAVALALTLGLKLLLYREPAPADNDVLGETVVAFLVQHGLEPRIEKRFNGVFVHANAGKCRMLIREVTPQGWNRSSVELLANEVGRLTYVFDGAVHTNEPFLTPMLRQYWTRLRIRIGLSPNRHPLLSVAASDDCAIEALPWWEISTLS